MSFRAHVAFGFTLVAGVAGCSSAGNSLAPDAGAPAGGGDMATLGAPAGQSLSVQIGPLAVPAGTEVVKCATMRLGNATDIDVVKIQTTLAPGSHHLILYKSDVTTESPPTDCYSFDGVFLGETPIFIAESATSTLQLPAGVAYHFPKGQMMRLEAHYIAAGAAVMGMGKIDLITGQSGISYQAADIMMCGNFRSLSCRAGMGGLPPHQAATSLPIGFYGGGGDVDFTKLNVFAFTSHTHRRGIDVKVWKSTGTTAGATPLYDNTSWDNPPLQTYPDNSLLTFKASEGFAWQCTYDTTADSAPVCFGESAALNEMCFIWAYYYPSVGRFISTNDCWNN
jgi:hypothetical protein